MLVVAFKDFFQEHLKHNFTLYVVSLEGSRTFAQVVFHTPTSGTTHLSPLVQLTIDVQILHIFISFGILLIVVNKYFRWVQLWIICAFKVVKHNNFRFCLKLCYTQLHC